MIAGLVGVEDEIDGVGVLLDDGEDAIGGDGRDHRVRGGVVEVGVDDDGAAGRRVRDDVLPGLGGLLVEGVD